MSFPFLLKKIITALIEPLSLITFALITAFLLRKKYKSLAKGLAACSLGFLYLISLPPFSSIVMTPLESEFPKYDDQAVEYVLVLGGAHMVDDKLPLSATLSGISMTRLIEGIHIYNKNPGAKLLLSGYSGEEDESHAKVSCRMALSLGVKESDIILAETVKDTRQEAKHWTKVIGDKPFALVTSASHLPRAVELFQHYHGVNSNINNDVDKNVMSEIKVIPAPTDYRASSSDLTYWRNWVPSAGAIKIFSAAWHEYIGMLWNKIIL